LIELAEVIRQLRMELDRAREAAADEVLQFELGPVELEVLVALEAAAGAGAKIRFWVVEVGGDAQATSTSTQRIKLTLHPTVGDSGGSGQQLSAFVSGSQVPGER
jgi:Trypsin-co-occurring domain 2